MPLNSSWLSDLGRRTAPPPISWLMELTIRKPSLVSLAAGFTDSESLPVNESLELLQGILRKPREGRASLQYGTTLGNPRLRDLTATRLQQQDEAPSAGRTYFPSNLLITSGSQQLLYMVTEALCNPGDLVLVEDPTYFVYLGIMQSHGLTGRGIRMQEDGIDLSHLERTLEDLRWSGDLARLKLLYLVTYHQNPTGNCTRFEKKAAALEMLRHYERHAGHPIYLLEDAAYRELRFSGPGIKSALACKHGSTRVIYSGTYSKPFATGVRVGFGILPAPLFTAVERIKGNHDFGTSNLLQVLLTRALEEGVYEEHLSVIRARYAHKAAAMASAIQGHFPAGVSWRKPEGGLYIWAQVPRRLKTGLRSRFFKAALKEDVLYVPGELCYVADSARPKPNHEMRLSYGGATTPDIKEGITRLGRTLQKLL